MKMPKFSLGEQLDESVIRSERMRHIGYVEGEDVDLYFSPEEDTFYCLDNDRMIISRAKPKESYRKERR